MPSSFTHPTKFMFTFTGSSDTAATISKCAAERHADLLVVGTRGLGALKRNLLGALGLGSVRCVRVCFSS